MKGRHLATGIALALAGCAHTEANVPTEGIVEFRDVDLQNVRLRLATPMRCRDGAPPAPDGTRHDCDSRPYRDVVHLTFEAASMRESYGPLEAKTDRDGHLVLEFSALDEQLRSRGVSHGLSAFDTLVIGTNGWGGRIDLVRWRSSCALWHLEWVSRGRGAPGLFLRAHPKHERSGEIAEIAVEAQLARQQVDEIGRASCRERV